MAINFPNISPFLFQSAWISIRWYSLSYALGILLTCYYLFRQKILSKNQADELLIYLLLGVVLGGRIGYILFYNLDFYLMHPLEMLKIWNGGMSFHGGALGAMLGTWYYSKLQGLNFWNLCDGVVCIAPVGLGLGRITNFINAELYGNYTDMPWGVIFPNETMPRHPSQLYEALLEGLLLFCIMQFAKNTIIGRRTGSLLWLFFVSYSVMRFFVEFFRLPDEQLGYIMMNLTMGQWLSVAFGFISILGLVLTSLETLRT